MADTGRNVVVRRTLSRRQLFRGAVGLGGAAVLAAAVSGCSVIEPLVPGGKSKLTVLTHWGAQNYQDVMQPLLQEYQKQDSRAEIEYQTVPFDQLLSRITTGRAAGVSPDVYHVYNLWLPEFAKSQILAPPPKEVLDDLRQSYTKGSVDAVSYQGQAWGYPTEVNSYLLLYNKAHYQESGVAKPPATWSELKETSAKLTKRGSDGKVLQAGLVFITGWDSGVVHPWTAMLWTNGGEYVASDHSKVQFAEEPGRQTVQLTLDLINEVKAVDLAVKRDDFIAGKASQIVMANWWRTALAKGFPGGLENVGVANIPRGKASDATLQYNWLWVVDKSSKVSDEAWKFVRGMNMPTQEGKASPSGVFLMEALGAIPSRRSDQQAYQSRLGDSFLAPFIKSLEVARTEPIIPGGQEIKTILQKQIEAAWFGQKSGTEALDTAAREANKILAEKGKG